MLFDAYVPTRTSNLLEVRVRSECGGQVALRLGAAQTELCEPLLSHRGRYFYRHAFRNLPAATEFRLRVLGASTGAEKTFDTSTLPEPSRKCKLSVGLLPDLHLSLERGTIDDYRPGHKRLFGLGIELAERYIQRLEILGADAIVLPGDLVEPCTERTVRMLREILGRVGIPCYPMIGNHEPWSPDGTALFCRGLGLPSAGFYAVTLGGVRLIMLNTPAPDALTRGGAQYRWLEAELAAAPPLDVVLFSHFSLVLHPCVQGFRHDGYQLLDSHRVLLELLARYPNVRVFSAGHKNVPSKLLRDRTLHLLSPQLIQAPCAYDMLRMYEDGVSRTTYEIDEQHYVEVARGAYEHDWLMRYGDEASRNFWHAYPES
jgi:3',5'-cyclic AMP phosphodiesterase CpdA